MFPLKKATLLLSNVKLHPSQIHKFRGFVGNLFAERDLIHNHDPVSGKVIYRYPLIQFKLTGNTPSIVAVTELGIAAFSDLFIKLDSITINGLKVAVFEKDLKVETVDFGYSIKTHRYEFQSPWLALNQKNYQVYEKAKSGEERNALLRGILIGNLLSMSKSLGYRLHAGQTIHADLDIKPATVKLKGNTMLGFRGRFETNFIIPNQLGVGKSVSRGFGSIKRIS